ncbi:MAG TPA: hypothetical protein VFE37_04735 [Chloroflexota bacterium]|nr:hypothetical protein [Chloroflexota bacterium]
MSQPVVSGRFPYLPLHMTVGQHTEDLEALLDTGFDGDLAVPADSLPSGQRPTGYNRWILADGSSVFAITYRGTVQVGPFGPFPVLVTAIGDEPLVGRGVSDRLRITLDHGQQVIIEP